jgi:hypothetical protein
MIILSDNLATGHNFRRLGFPFGPRRAYKKRSGTETHQTGKAN